VHIRRHWSNCPGQGAPQNVRPWSLVKLTPWCSRRRHNWAGSCRRDQAARSSELLWCGSSDGSPVAIVEAG
jgi:hypothetical protein